VFPLPPLPASFGAPPLDGLVPPLDGLVPPLDELVPPLDELVPPLPVKPPVDVCPPLPPPVVPPDTVAPPLALVAPPEFEPPLAVAPPLDVDAPPVSVESPLPPPFEPQPERATNRSAENPTRIEDEVFIAEFPSSSRLTLPSRTCSICVHKDKIEHVAFALGRAELARRQRAALEMRG
jgi:hypothetical protein